mmetsp:Transcript_22983/g.49891  ORF Transcript_22983/g.49891 Transcript_22983/m.49891 type:complete len:270 (+) Transcript_22983:3-812(+)
MQHEERQVQQHVVVRVVDAAETEQQHVASAAVAASTTAAAAVELATEANGNSDQNTEGDDDAPKAEPVDENVPSAIGIQLRSDTAAAAGGRTRNPTGNGSKAANPTFELKGLRLAIGSRAGYVHLWSSAADEDDGGRFGNWTRLDNGELDERRTTETVVAKGGTGLRVFVGYPYLNDGRGVVRAYDIESDPNATDVVAPTVSIRQLTAGSPNRAFNISHHRQGRSELAPTRPKMLDNSSKSAEINPRSFFTSCISERQFLVSAALWKYM